MSARQGGQSPPWGMHELVTETAREAVAVAQALGYDIDEQERVDYIHALLERAGPAKASMLQDFEAGRQTLKRAKPKP